MERNNSKVKGIVSRALTLMLVFVMVATAVLAGAGGFREEVYAKAIGAKNQQACDACKAVRAGTAPSGYTDVLGNKAVYRGGTATSGLQTGQSFDTDPNTFASPLPYGDTYVDVSMLNWTDGATYIIDIPKDSPFQWVATTQAGAALKDANKLSPETDPMGSGKGISSWKDQDNNRSSVIAYVGPLKGFHDNFTDAATDTGYTNEITAAKYGVPYLYKITYPGAVTLPTGVRGNLVITVSQVDIETAFTVDEEHPRTLTAKDNSTYKYTQGIVAVQSGNDMATSTAFIDGEGNYIVQDLGLALTTEQVRAKLTTAGVASQNNINASSQNKYTRGATGVHVDLDINVTDADGKGIDGTISYAAMDLDLPSYQNVWGRKSTGDDRLKFSEGLEIISGSQSYALVPVYNHANATTVATGWVPVGPFDARRDSPLDISGGSGTNADGVNFRSTSLINFRDSNGKWDNVPFYVSGTATEASQKEMRAYPNGNPWGRDYDALDKGGQLTRPYLDMKPGWSVKASTGASTAQEALALLGDASWATERGDANTYDTGFAVLLDAKSSKLRWSGSTSSTGTVITNLFDSKLFTYIEQTHGTGGGIYLESYKINDACNPVAKEGVVTMGRGATATVTAVPEEGYRVKRFLLGGTKPSNRVEYTIEALGLTPGVAGQKVITAYAYGGDYYEEQSAAEAAAVADEHTAADVTEQHITFEMNADGTVDVSFDSVTDPRHIHVDFTADYYFYKIWKGDEEPTKLNMTAVPYAYIFTDVTLPVQTGIDAEGHAVYTDTHFSINGTEYTAADGTKYVLNANNTLETVAKDAGGNPLVTLPWVLRGNSFENDTTGEKYDVTVQFGVNFAMGDGTMDEDKVKKTFTVNGTEKYVTVLGKDDTNNTISPGNVVWKIKYPEEGDTSLSWPALPIETNPAAHNVNHVERNYWFATEEAPGWSKESYDNSKAEAPGVVPTPASPNESYYDNHVWAAASKKDYNDAKQMIQVTNKTKNAFMSVFSKDANTTDNTYGGEIVNIPSVVVKAEKTWEDFKNGFNTRQAIWLHIDAKIGSETKKDILPPQKLAPGTAEIDTVTWGDKTVYETNQDNIKIIHDLSEIPLKDEHDQRVTYTHESDGSYKASNGVTYWLNELEKVTKNGTIIEYTIRETLDAAGNESVKPADPTSGLIGYTADADEVAWSKMNRNAPKTTIDGVDVLTYEGKLKNKLELTDFEVTKIWKENGANRTHSLSTDVDKLKTAFILYESDERIADTDELKLQPSTAAEYVADPESGTLETKNGKDTTEVVFKWHNIPKYVGDDSGDKPHLAVYSITENQLNGYTTPQYSSEGKALDKGTITNEVTPPEGTPKQTWGDKDQPQSVSGKDMFKVTTDTDIEGNSNEIKEVKLINPKTGKPADSVTVPEGTYTVGTDGTITFTPVTGFVGNPTPVGVRGTDANGLTADTTYTPHICDTETTVKRTIVYEYSNGDPVLEDGKPKTVEQTVTFKGVVNPDTGEITYPGNPTETFPEVPSDDITGYTVDRPKVEDETVRPRDKDLFEKVIYSPKEVTATPDRTYGLPNESQNGTLTFDMQTPTYTDESPNELTIKLVDPTTGKEVDDKNVPAVDDEGNTVGTYTLNDNGTVTYTPSKDYVGNPRPLEVTGTDRFGKKARTTYTPHIVDPVIEDEASRNITYTYLTEDGKEASATITQKVTMKRHAKKVDPKTGEVLEWAPWEPAEFPAVPNPGHVDEKTWTANKSAQKAIVTEPGPAEDVHVVYTKEPYTVIYHNGEHGKSDGKGDQSNEDYGNDVTGGNGVTPAKGWHFTGKYTYVIKDKNGNVIKTGETDNPTTVEIIGNVEFTPVYAPNKYTIKYDPNGGKGKMGDQKFTGKDDSATSKSNKFTRKGYVFTGFKAKLPDGTYLKDANGNDLIFKNPDDFIEYLHAQGDGGEITLEAQWVKADAEDADGSGGAGTGDDTNLYIWISIMAAALASAFVVMARRRRA